MDISRKDFFKKSLYSLGEAITTVTGALKEPHNERPTIRDTADFVPVQRENMRAIARNERCLARNCGCFACFERCEAQAITVVMGEGIRIDKAKCTGCGTCEYVCPVTPKAVELQPCNEPEPPARDAASSITRGE
ncbi:MAG: 4Fe-4S binding protein [Oryzomonas sp.]|uniref:4Fe-4S binding protein n=1 Tax=Oryzomonas sp. TaxID=2855186 RepID=UPI0028403D51|nr:4Fe-4S binding protein [Oryzomonas sp.]MDR3579907.1 4Fe-4S binding protein [Oryzomonas sp.]